MSQFQFQTAVNSRQHFKLRAKETLIYGTAKIAPQGSDLELYEACWSFLLVELRCKVLQAVLAILNTWQFRT